MELPIKHILQGLALVVVMLLCQLCNACAIFPGEKDVFVVGDDANKVISIPSYDKFFTIWDVEYQDRVKVVIAEGLYFQVMQYINETHLAVWDYHTKYDIFLFLRLMPFRPLFPCVLQFIDITWPKGAIIQLGHFTPSRSGSLCFNQIARSLEFSFHPVRR